MVGYKDVRVRKIEFKTNNQLLCHVVNKIYHITFLILVEHIKSNIIYKLIKLTLGSLGYLWSISGAILVINQSNLLQEVYDTCGAYQEQYYL